LSAEIGCLTTHVAWLKKLASTMSRNERLALVERAHGAMPVAIQLMDPSNDMDEIEPFGGG